MLNPLWLDDLLGGIMLAVAVYSAGRLLAARIWSRPIHRDIDVAHVLMGTSMAGQLVSDLNPVPNGVWELTFAGMATWFGWRCIEFMRDPVADRGYADHVHRLSRRAIHLTMALAMLYMYLAAVPVRIGTGMAMGTPTGATENFVLIPMIFILSLLGSAVWTLDRISRFAPSAVSPEASRALLTVGAGTAPPNHLAEGDNQALRPWLAPRLEEGAHIVMVVTMAYMLVLML